VMIRQIQRRLRFTWTMGLVVDCSKVLASCGSTIAKMMTDRRLLNCGGVATALDPGSGRNGG
jgi:hypothetical protein